MALEHDLENPPIAVEVPIFGTLNVRRRTVRTIIRYEAVCEAMEVDPDMENFVNNGAFADKAAYRRNRRRLLALLAVILSDGEQHVRNWETIADQINVWEDVENALWRTWWIFYTGADNLAEVMASRAEDDAGNAAGEGDAPAASSPNLTAASTPASDTSTTSESLSSST